VGGIAGDKPRDRSRRVVREPQATREKVAGGAALLGALALVAGGVFALVITWVLSRESSADQLGAVGTVVLFVLAIAGLGSALWGMGEALLGLTKARHLRLCATCLGVAAFSYAGWVAFAFYLLWRAVSQGPG